jgi:ABC-type uncharacterized transport system permease subunit
MGHWFLSPIVLFWGVSLFFCWTDFRLGRQQKSLPAWLFFLTGWLTQFAFLYMRGTSVGRCPVGTLPEILTFISWALGGTYLILNVFYRSNALACYAITTTTAFQAVTLFLPRTISGAGQWNSTWATLHVVLFILAYAAFCLAALLAAMYLLKDRQLKTHQLTSGTMTFPAVTNLELWMKRVVFAGFVLFTVGLITGFVWLENLPVGQRHYDYKICWAATVWLAYLVLILAHRFHWMRRRNAAWLCVIFTTFTLLSFWGINSISTYHKFQ